MSDAHSIDEKFMKQALKLARYGLGKTSPNPMVGSVIIRDGRIIGRGYHHHFGGKHAEVNAIENATENIAGADMYITLEPCFHYGKTPPCIDVVINSHPHRVIIGMLDPDPRVQGRSLEKLKGAGIETIVGVLEDECRYLNEAYIKHRSIGIPFVTLKFAQSLDGRIATVTGDSRWISSEESRKLAHKIRTHHDAILVGVGTVLIDNPELTVRMVRGRNPVRIILDSKLRISAESRVLTDQKKARTIVVTTDAADKEKATALEKTGIEVMIVPPDAQGKIDLKALLKSLGELDITSVLVEGGSEIITSFLRLGLADKLVVFIAPKLLGKGIEAIGDLNITEVNKSLNLNFIKVYRRGEDIVVEASIISEGN